MTQMESAPHQINTISELHRLLGLPKPLHPMVSLVRNCDVHLLREEFPQSLFLNFYKISYMGNLHGKVKYGQSYYDFDEGGMVFVAPGQLLTAPTDADEYEGFNLFVHPDFLQGYPLAGAIKKYHFFTYATNEALHLSDKEKKTVLSVFGIIEDELNERIDDTTQDVIIAQIDLLLHYSNRFYKRQFVTRKIINHDLLTALEKLLDDYFNTETALMQGLPTVQYLAGQLHVSSHYLSDMLRSLTGQSAQQHIHRKVVEKAKEMLSTSKLSVAEIAYNVGFGHPQSFNKLFKSKTKLSPLEYRQAFN
ncbi:helix-turn-helix transcriptional regulator [Chitinophaga sp. G-6-1-13]|uniref:Helix-turn-helix transcriptional regulator n=1 Tax=Chitinophaga fulva TaxID=2728842 RepID=A0A848GZE1_9BACT|nr:helix-turn-helix transcriptional regulator [Chitinophaga fulva]NML41933.1 helix-turn-helix transcriptional regulator [Chitinophaga fulva]